MQRFPALDDNQVALLRAQFSTGHVLDDNFQMALNKGQNVYTVFNDINLAMEYADHTIKTNKDLEIVIYGRGKEVVKYISQ
jgi:hypothetical protein